MHAVMIERDGICEIQEDMGAKLLEFAEVLPSPIFQIGVFASVSSPKSRIYRFAKVLPHQSFALI